MRLLEWLAKLECWESEKTTDSDLTSKCCGIIINLNALVDGSKIQQENHRKDVWKPDSKSGINYLWLAQLVSPRISLNHQQFHTFSIREHKPKILG